MDNNKIFRLDQEVKGEAMSDKFEDCMWLYSYLAYEPCNDGHGEYPTGPVYECEYTDTPGFEKCKDCPANPVSG